MSMETGVMFEHKWDETICYFRAIGKYQFPNLIMPSEKWVLYQIPLPINPTISSVAKLFCRKLLAGLFVLDNLVIVCDFFDSISKKKKIVTLNIITIKYRLPHGW